MIIALSIIILFLLSSVTLVLGKGTNRIVEENFNHDGNSDWWKMQQLNENGPLGFSDTISLEPGEEINFKIDSSLQSQENVSRLSSISFQFQLLIFRLGYYNGKGARLMSNITISVPSKKVFQPPCHFELTSRMVDCANWEVTTTWKVPIDATTGVYIALPIRYINDSSSFVKNSEREEERGSYIPFIVRQPSHSHQSSDILFKTSDLTWVAYNKYGGWNVYRGNGSYTFDSRAYKASYNRPFMNRLPKHRGQHENFFLGSEYAMIYWLEKHGYDVSYASCSDVEFLGNTYSSVLSKNNVKDIGKPAATPSLLVEKYKVILSVGHDEYWTPGLRKAVENAREKGVNLAFFSGNEVFWRVRWQFNKSSTSSSSNTPSLSLMSSDALSKRYIIVGKESMEGILPAGQRAEDWTGTFMDPRFREAEPQNALTGQLFMVNGFRQDAMVVTARDGRMRFWRNTSLSLSLFEMKSSENYHSQPGLLGYEWDAFSDDCHRPPGLFTLSNTVFKLTGYLLQNYGAAYKGDGIVSHKLSLYRHYSRLNNSLNSTSFVSSLVFGAGTIQWAWALRWV